ncbi:MAG TPA: circadian clock KaiB family protein [Longimicrobiales bacterium]|nr:circadian clock KaiB family protein [Longimicrobiales bacterium]
MKTFQFTLFVAGRTARAEQAIRSLQELCDQHLGGDAEFQVVDVLAHPEIADRERVLSTPTLDKREPQPARRVIGDLSDPSRLIPALALYLDMDPDTDTEGTR